MGLGVVADTDADKEPPIDDHRHILTVRPSTARTRPDPKDMLPMHCTGSDPDHSMKFPLVSQRITRARALGLQTRHYHALMAKDALDEDMDAPLSPLGPPCSSELRTGLGHSRARGVEAGRRR